MKSKLQIIVALLFPLCVSGQDPSVVRFVNAGKMTVAPALNNVSGVTLHIPNAVRVIRSSAIIQNGITEIGGNFYQDSDANAFVTAPDGRGISQGTVSFITTNGSQRIITSSSIANFNRGINYVAFPILETATDDELLIPSRMGIDAISIKCTGTGKIRLESATDDLDNTMDASLRITGTGSSASNVPLGAMIVERNVVPYRAVSGTPTNNLPLFAFASPFENNQRSGYFAGNWIRRLIADDNNYGHVRFVYGNESSNGEIIRSQYIRNPEEPFQVGNGYLIKLQPAGFDYSSLKDAGALSITNANPINYNKSEFVFDGTVYTLSSQNEQLFASDILYSRTINTIPSYTVNWVIGNSYTSSLSIAAIEQKIINSPLVFDPNIYVFPAGSTTYQVHKIAPNPTTTMEILGLKEIPAMSLFMLRLSKNKTQNGTFIIGKEDLVHSTSTHNKLKSAPVYNNEVLFRVTPEENNFLYDIAGVAIRSSGKNGLDKGDIQKMYNDNNELFQLYFQSSDGNRLSAEILPPGSEKAILCLSPGQYSGKLVLSASRMESLSDGILQLEDLKNGNIIDLMQNNGKYAFEITSGDIPQRFIVHFNSQPTAIDRFNKEEELQIFSDGDHLIISRLTEFDLGSKLVVYDINGRCLFQKEIDTTPRMQLSMKLQKGLYIVRITGKRNVSHKLEL